MAATYEIASFCGARFQNKPRLETLVQAGRLTEEEYRELTGSTKDE